MTSSRSWWQDEVFYQIYPRSFADSDGDGTGDLRGIAARLDHLIELGVGAVWVSPVYPSPMDDFGYDVAEYCDVDPLFGTLEDMDALIAAVHARGLRLVLDFVPNHTSDRHRWFTKSRADRSNACHDWYLWHNPAPDGGPPNNWQSHFGGPAWTFAPERGQFYCHSFLPSQPDLNWRNPAVRAVMADVLRFWIDRGVDGFRVDVIWLLIKDALWRDNPPGQDGLHNADQQEVHETIAGLRQVLDTFGGRVMIGEIYLPLERLVTYYGPPSRPECHLPFNFQLLLLDRWDAAALAGLITQYEALLPPGAWPNWVLGNHDRPRVATRLGPAQARVAAVLLLTLRGTPTIYMGDELGMVDTPIPADTVRDPAELRRPGRGFGRDPERTPFPWRPGPGAGFTTGTPWLPIGEDVPLSVQRDDPRSSYALHRALLALRRQEPALVQGTIAEVRADGPVLGFRRHLAGARSLHVLANTGSGMVRVDAVHGTVLLSTHRTVAVPVLSGTLVLQPDEALILAV